MLKLLIYYGWLSAFNSGVNQWNNDSVAHDFAKYQIIVFGDGIADPNHSDYTNTVYVTAKIKQYNPETKIFGYVSSNQNYSSFCAKVDLLANICVDGVFMDESGYDFGVTRANFNQKVTYIKTKLYRACFVNAWNIDHVLGTTNDPSYPNSVYNPGLAVSNLEIGDWYTAESFVVNPSYPGGFATASDWKTRGDKIKNSRNTYRINVAASGVIDNNDINGQSKSDFSYHAALGYEFQAHGTSDINYAASSAAVKMFNDAINVYWRTGTSIAWTKSGNIYYRNGQNQQRLNLNFNTQQSYLTTY
jgi:hypothetical protein